MACQSSKIVVFDIDETLGYFFQFSIFWEALSSFIKKQDINYKLTQQDFNKIFDLFPEFIRPNIISILNYLKYKKNKNACKSVMIYTNNQGPKEWVYFIKKYFEKKINYNLFDQIISAFKINGKQMELHRTTHDKTIADLIKCCKLPINVEICFIDNTYYPEMNADNVYYIKVNPYIYNLPFDVVMKRFITSPFFSSGSGIFDTTCASQLEKYFEKYIAVLNRRINTQYKFTEKTKKEYNIDKIITKKIMIYIQKFIDNDLKEK